MRVRVILYPGVFFLFLNSYAVSETLPNVVCYPSEKIINVAEASKIAIECSVEVSNDVLPKFEWSTSDDEAIQNMVITENIVQDGEYRNFTSISTIYSKDSSPTFLTEVDVQIVVRFREEASREQTFKLRFGNNTNLIIIIVGGVLGTMILISIVTGTVVFAIRQRRHRTGDGIGGNHSSQDGNEDDWHDVDLRADDLRPHQVMQRHSDSFSEQDNVGVYNDGYNDVIDNLTSLANENFSERPISKFISQMSTEPRVIDPEFVEADRLPSMGSARVAIGGGADLGAGQVHVRDHEELEVIQRDLGSGYTAIRKISTGEYGFLPTTSLIFSD